MRFPIVHSTVARPRAVGEFRHINSGLTQTREACQLGQLRGGVVPAYCSQAVQPSRYSPAS
jgi:hypothetical protein